MEDLDKSGIFDDIKIKAEDEDWFFEEEKANIMFSSMPPAEKLKALRDVEERKKQADKAAEHGKFQHIINTERRIREKREQLIREGVIPPDPPSKKKKSTKITRYGRNPLHEAVDMRNIKLVKKYATNDEYMNQTDNNGHTPLEMAFHQNYKEALIVFEAVLKKKSK